MYVPDEIRSGVAFVGYQMANGTFKMAGTAFLVGRDVKGTPNLAFVYVVTARHVLEKIRGYGLDKVFVRFNLMFSGSEWLETDLSDWVYHPSEPTVDVAVFQPKLPSLTHYVLFPLDLFLSDDTLREENIGLGDEVIIVGLFSSFYGKDRNIPIIRVGNIAAFAEEKIDATAFGPMDAMLIEARSIGGISGSPVFVHPGLVRVRNGQVVMEKAEPKFYLLGLIHAHFDETSTEAVGKDDFTADASRVNQGIAIVVPAPKILEVINQPKLLAYEQQITEQFEKRNNLDAGS